MVKLLTQIIGVGIETADKLVHEILSRRLRDRRVVARSIVGMIGDLKIGSFISIPDVAGQRSKIDHQRCG
jgi:hypothetical protein